MLPLLLLLGSWGSASVLAQPHIDHPGIECVAPGRFAVILSGIDPELEIHTAKVYFRSSLYPDFYFVEMTREQGRFVAVLPKPTPETTQIIYYIEAIDGVFESARSVEWDPLVEECEDDPAAAYFTGEAPGIVVGATTSGAATLPPGFSAAGIIGTIAATGIATGIGGGVGAGTAIAVGAVAVGAAGATVAVSGTEETTTTVAASAPTPDPAPSPSASTSTVRDPSPTSTTSTTPGPTSTTTPPGTTTVPAGSTTTSAGTTTAPTTSTTSSVTTTTSAPPLNPDCFSVTVLGNCRVRVDASCVNPPVDRYDWVLDVDDRWERITIVNGGNSATHDWIGKCSGSGKTLKFRLTVHRGGGTAVAVKSINVPGKNGLKAPPQHVRFLSRLDLPPFDGSVRGRILINDNLAGGVDGSRVATIEARAVSGTNRLTATLTREASGPGRWSFELGQQPNLVRGSLRVVHGGVLTLEPDSIVFHLTGHAQERVELTFELRP